MAVVCTGLRAPAIASKNAAGSYRRSVVNLIDGDTVLRVRRLSSRQVLPLCTSVV